MEPKNLHIRGTIQIPGTDTHIPRLGLGVYKIRDDTCTQACLIAINCGYRSIDSAQLYRNEAHVGAAVAQSSLPRDQLFITTKISRAQATEDDTHSKLLESVEKIGGSQGYVDLFLIHVPGSDAAKRKRLWASLEKLHAQGKAKTIGVSNFHISHIEEMREYAQIWPPHVNQIEARLLLHGPMLRTAHLIIFTASSLVPAKRTGQLLPRQRHSRTGIQSAGHWRASPGPYSRACRIQARQVACPNSHPVQPAEGLGHAAEKPEPRKNQRKCKCFRFHVGLDRHART
jgi:aryl-alcohol dehydrogenase-like predicted oxidoreductase